MFRAALSSAVTGCESASAIRRTHRLEQCRSPSCRIRVAGKLFAVGDERWYLKGLTYGPFASNSDGHFLPDRAQLLADLAHMRRLGANAIRVYHVPPAGVLDDALEHGLRVMIDVPWEKHRCFFEDWSAQQEALRRVRTTAREVGH